MDAHGNKPKISVIIPMYNCEPYIEDCIKSLLSQTLSDFEAFCVDDGSTDYTFKKAQECSQGDSRFTFDVLPENKGQSVARNLALEKASGDYIVFLDADDYLITTALEKLYKRASDQQLDELYFSAQSFYDSLNSRKLVREDYAGRISFDEVATGQELFSFFQENKQFFPQGAFRMVKRSVIESHHLRFYEGIIHEDLLFTFQALAVSERSSFLNEKLYQRRIREGSTMTINARQSLKSVHGHFICVTEMRKWLYDHAEQLSKRFVKAITESLNEFLLKASNDWAENDDEEAKSVYLGSLSPHDYLRFYEEVIQRGSAVIKIENEYLASKTYRLGDAILKIPRSIKEGAKTKAEYKSNQGQKE